MSHPSSNLTSNNFYDHNFMTSFHSSDCPNLGIVQLSSNSFEIFPYFSSNLKCNFISLKQNSISTLLTNLINYQRLSIMIFFYSGYAHVRFINRYFCHIIYQESTKSFLTRDFYIIYDNN
jgi:hypothetical protein